MSKRDIARRQYWRQQVEAWRSRGTTTRSYVCVSPSHLPWLCGLRNDLRGYSHRCGLPGVWQEFGDAAVGMGG
jgi:hypothetical protein